MSVARKRYVEAEPLSLGAAEIVEFLRDMGWAGAAAMVRLWADRSTEQNREAMRWRTAYQEVVERLHKYEPPAPRPEPVNFQPPPEASD